MFHLPNVKLYLMCKVNERQRRAIKFLSGFETKIKHSFIVQQSIKKNNKQNKINILFPQDVLLAFLIYY